MFPPQLPPIRTIASIKDLKQYVQEWLERNHVSANQLAQLSGVPQPCLSRWLAGKRGLSLATAEKLINFLHNTACFGMPGNQKEQQCTPSS